MDDGLVEMVVESVRVHMLSSRHVVILKETARDRYLPIWIGPWEASAIAMKLQGLTPERPLTHDLFASTLEELGARIDRVVISELADETFHARILLERDGRTVEVDARPSDALALAVRSKVPIYAAEAVLEQAALGGDAGIVDDEGEEGSTLETDRRAGGRSAPRRLPRFRQLARRRRRGREPLELGEQTRRLRGPVADAPGSACGRRNRRCTPGRSGRRAT